jgi:hypothetical protein
VLRDEDAAPIGLGEHPGRGEPHPEGRHMRAEGKMALANGATDWLPWAAPWCDIPGHEVHWADDRGFHPEPGDYVACGRAMACRRPFVFQVHFDRTDFPREWVEAALRLGVAYGFSPTMGAAQGGTGNAAGDGYWTQPKWYERDRDLHRKYVPVIQALSAAGWEPVTCARSDSPAVYVERFGRPGAPLYLTIFNDSPSPRTSTSNWSSSRWGSRREHSP